LPGTHPPRTQDPHTADKRSFLPSPSRPRNQAEPRKRRAPQRRLGRRRHRLLPQDPRAPPLRSPGGGMPGMHLSCLSCSTIPVRLALSHQRPQTQRRLGLSDDKRQKPSQRVTFTGMVVDTFLRTLSIPTDKKIRLATFLESFFDLRECTLSQLASF
jgi:hypothetical protein